MGDTLSTPTPFLFQNLHGSDPEIDRRSQAAELWLDFLGAVIVTTTDATATSTMSVCLSTVRCSYSALLTLTGVVQTTAAQSVSFVLDGASVGPPFAVTAGSAVTFGWTTTSVAAAGYHTVSLDTADAITLAELSIQRRRPLAI